jgi:hypothetical protein
VEPTARLRVGDTLRAAAVVERAMSQLRAEAFHSTQAHRRTEPRQSAAKLPGAIRVWPGSPACTQVHREADQALARLELPARLVALPWAAPMERRPPAELLVTQDRRAMPDQPVALGPASLHFILRQQAFLPARTVVCAATRGTGRARVTRQRIDAEVAASGAGALTS